MSSKHAASLISKLSTDADFRKRFRANPDAVMDEEGLSPEDKEVMKSGDPDRIKQHLGDDAPPGCFVMFV
jgi:putative modified peptide